MVSLNTKVEIKSLCSFFCCSLSRLKQMSGLDEHLFLVQITSLDIWMLCGRTRTVVGMEMCQTHLVISGLNYKTEHT